MKMSKTRAFHSDPKIKAKYLARVEAHAKADQLIQGTGWDHGKGCAVGCTLDAYDHARYTIELGIPERIAYLEDAIFEGLPRGDAMKWPSRFLKTIKPGADLEWVWHDFQAWLIRDMINNFALVSAAKFPAMIESCEVVASLFASHTPVEDPKWIAAYSAAYSAARAARGASYSAARSAARSAAYSAARSAAYSAAYSAASAADSAAYSAASAADSAAYSAASAAYSAAWVKMADKLIELLKAAPNA